MAEQLGKIEAEGQTMAFRDSNGSGCSVDVNNNCVGIYMGAGLGPVFDRIQVKALIGHLQGWLDTGRLSPNPDITPADERFAARIAGEIVKRLKSPAFEDLVRDAAEAKDWLHIPSALDRLKNRVNEADGQEIGRSGGWHFRSMRRPEALFLKVSSEHEPFTFSTVPLSLVAALLSLLSDDLESLPDEPRSGEQTGQHS